MAGETLGFIGTGRMGGPMAARLLEAGYAVIVYDTQAEATKALVARGARVANSAAEVASASDIVLASLPTPDIVKTVALGPNGISSGNRARIIIDLSTSGPGAAKLIAQEFAPRNITLVDAPVSGGIKGAVAGTLAVMVSCPKPTYDIVEPILKTFGKLFYTGDKPGTAQTAKLANNLMAAAALVITSEAVAMGVKGGVDAKVLIDIINASSGRNSASEDKFKLVLGCAVAAAARIDDVDQDFCVDAALDAHRHGFGGDDESGRRHQIVGELGRLRGTGLVSGIEQLAERLQDRFDDVVGRLRARHHDRERAGHRALDAAGHGCIDQRDVPRREFLRDQLGRAGTGGGEIDDDPCAIAGGDAVRSQCDGLDDVGCRQAGEHDVGRGG